MSAHNADFSPFSPIDAPYVSPEKYDVLVPDVDEKRLEQIGFREEISYLSPGRFPSPAFPVRGVLYGGYNRFMIPLVCQCARRPTAPIIHVWFLIDSGSPHTYLADKPLREIFGPGNEQKDDFLVAIQEQRTVIECYRNPSNSHFAEINLLGTNALLKLGISSIDRID